MPKQVTYRGTAHRAEITSDQWDAVGVKSADVEFNGYGDQQEIANDAADYLAQHDDRFEVEGSDDDSAYARRLRTDGLEHVRRERTGSPRSAVTPSTPLPATAPPSAATTTKAEGKS